MCNKTDENTPECFQMVHRKINVCFKSITSDETWIFQFNPEKKYSLSCKKPLPPRMKKVPQIKSNFKNTLIVLF